MNAIMRYLLTGYYIPGGRIYKGLDWNYRVMVYNRVTGHTAILRTIGPEGTY